MFRAARSFSTARRVLSRRAWKRPPPTPKPKPVEDNKPWPKSVVYTGYAAAAVLIPYCVAWAVAAQPVLRERVPEERLEQLRPHFGTTEDVTASSYPESLSEPRPQLLPGELTGRERAQERAIQELERSPLQVKRAKVVDGMLADTERIELAGDVLVSSLDDNKPGSYMAVSFVDDVEESDGLEPDFVIPTPSDPLLAEVAIYSSWHYHQAPAAAPAEQSNQQSHDEIEKSRLQHRLQELELELRNPTRSVDDILDEVSRTKSELRRMQWGRWAW